MIKKTVTWEDLNGGKHTEDLYFHIMEVEAAKLQVSKKGGLGEWLQAMVKSNDQAEIFNAFEMLISTGYGRRSADGLKHDKEPEWTAEFMKSPAYNALFVELITNEQAALEFVVGIMPASVVKGVDVNALQNATKGVPVDVKLPENDQLFRSPVMDDPKLIQPLPQELKIEDNVPPAFRRPPVEMARDPERVSNLTRSYSRDEILAAYDEIMAGRREGNDQPPPAA